MARQFLTTAVLSAAMLCIAAPAVAQFGTIFGDPPPRPPANVPRGAPPPADVAPEQPLPPPMNLPPSRRPGAAGIESQPLAPPSGTFAPPSNQPAQNAPQRLQPGPGLQQPSQQAAPAQPAPQRQPRGTAQQPPQPQQSSPQQQQVNVDPQPTDEVVVQPPEQKIANPTAVFSGLDKITGRTISFDVAINETVQFGALQVTPRACYSRPLTETPRTDAFVAVDEVTLQGEVRRIFTGWMFAASPGLHAVEHPIYDIWLTECKGAPQPVAEAPAEPAKPAAQQPAQRRRTPAQQPRAQQQPQPGFLPALR
jgi:hypothetical protein